MVAISPDELQTEEVTAVELKVKPPTLTQWRFRGIGPKYIKVGRAVFYRRADVAEWLGAQRREPQAHTS
jgi:hypothetical protein